MDYDEILKGVGYFSKWHIFQVFILSTYATFAAFGILSFSFTGLAPKEFRCLIPECQEDLKSATVDEYGTDIFWRDGEDIDYCKTRPVIESKIDSGHCANDSFNFDPHLKKSEYLTCNSNSKIVYGAFGMDSTAVTEYNLVCQDEYKVFLTASITMSAMLVGSYVFGYLADRIGRKITSIASLFIIGIGLLLGAFMPEYISFTAARFIAGFGSVGALVLGLGNCVEIVGLKYKTLAGLVSHIPFPIGEIIIGLLAMNVRDYSTFQWILSIPCFIMGILLIFLQSESPRWLIKRKKYAKASAVIQHILKFNKIDPSPHLSNITVQYPENASSHNNDTKGDINIADGPLGTLDLFRHAECRKVTIIMMTVWISVNIGYYGITLSSISLSSDIYLNFILQAVVEIPGTITCILLLDHVGRKPLLVTSLCLIGMCCVPAGVVAPSGLKTTLVITAKFGASMAFAVAYIHTVEMYPTVIRATGLGLSSLAGRIGGLLAPLVALYLPNLTFDTLPLILFGSLSILAGILACWLPETLGSPLVESLDDLYVVREHSKPFFSWWSSTQVYENIKMVNSLRTPIQKSNVKKYTS